MSRDGSAADQVTPEDLAYLLCPDCSSTVTPHEVRPGIVVAEIEHDGLCVIWQAIQRQRHQRPPPPSTSRGERP